MGDRVDGRVHAHVHRGRVILPQNGGQGPTPTWQSIQPPQADKLKVAAMDTCSALRLSEHLAEPRLLPGADPPHQPNPDP